MVMKMLQSSRQPIPTGKEMAIVCTNARNSDKIRQTLAVCLSPSRLRNRQGAKGVKLSKCTTKSIRCQPNVFPCG